MKRRRNPDITSVRKGEYLQYIQIAYARARPALNRKPFVDFTHGGLRLQAWKVRHEGHESIVWLGREPGSSCPADAGGVLLRQTGGWFVSVAGVSLPFQGKGIYPALLRALIQALPKGQEISTMEMFSEGARKTWAKLGATERGNKLVLKRNPVRGEWWIDDSGTALYADIDNGDMGHEAYVIDGLTRTILDKLDIDVPEQAGALTEWEDNIQAVMKEDGFDGMSGDFVDSKMKKTWPDAEQRDMAIKVAFGAGDARKYGMQYDGWKRVQRNNVETWTLTTADLKAITNGLWDAAGGEDIEDDEEFNIYVFNTKTWYENIPWSVLKEDDPGKLRIYGTKDNPRVMLKRAARVPSRLLARGTRVEMEHTRSKRAARIIASHHIAEDPRYYAKLAKMEGHNPPRPLSYAEAHRWEPMAKARGVSAVARSGRGFMRMYEKAGTWDNVNDYWRKRRAAFIARHMVQARQNGEKLWKADKGGKLRPSRRCLALIMWAYRPR
jgi:hypothetical protein